METLVYIRTWSAARSHNRVHARMEYAMNAHDTPATTINQNNELQQW